MHPHAAVLPVRRGLGPFGVGGVLGDQGGAQGFGGGGFDGDLAVVVACGGVVGGNGLQ